MIDPLHVSRVLSAPQEIHRAAYALEYPTTSSEAKLEIINELRQIVDLYEASLMALRNARLPTP